MTTIMDLEAYRPEPDDVRSYAPTRSRHLGHNGLGLRDKEDQPFIRATMWGPVDRTIIERCDKIREQRRKEREDAQGG